MSEEIKKCDNCLCEFEIIPTNKISQDLESMYCPFCSFELIEYVDDSDIGEDEIEYDEDDL